MNSGIRNQIRDLNERAKDLSARHRTFIPRLSKAPVSYKLSSAQYRYLKIIARRMDKGTV